MLRLWHPICISSEDMVAMTTTVTFHTSQIHRSDSLTREGNPIPSPSAIMEMLSGLLVIDRGGLLEFSCRKGILAGASLVGYRDAVEIERAGLRAGEEVLRRRVTVLGNPTYRLALASPDRDLVEELVTKLEKWGEGSGDRWCPRFIPPKSIGNVRRATLTVEREAEGYCSLDDLESVRGGDMVILEFIREGKVTKYASALGGFLVAREAMPVVSDGESRIFVHRTWEFLI